MQGLHVDGRYIEQRIAIMFCIKSSLQMKHCAINMIPKANENFPMETADIPTTQQSSHVEITNEYNTYHFTVHFELVPQS
jgi:hypothetical protein